MEPQIDKILHHPALILVFALWIVEMTCPSSLAQRKKYWHSFHIRVFVFAMGFIFPKEEIKMAEVTVGALFNH